MRTRVYNNKEQIFCDWRRKWVRLTPEEWVRQQLLHRLVEQLDYPSSLIAVEVPFRLPSFQGEGLCPIERPVDGHRTSLGGKLFRCDAVVYDNTMQPLMIIECKAETVPLTQKTLDQAINYNRKLNVPHLLLCNGIQAIYVNGNDINTSGLPRYADLLRRE